MDGSIERFIVDSGKYKLVTGNVYNENSLQREIRRAKPGILRSW